MPKFYVSPPFGTYLRIKNTIPILGTFTAYERKGKWIQILKTLRTTKDGGYINKIGLRNKGILSVKKPKKSHVLSFSALNINDFYILNDYIKQYQITNTLEINEGCPNAPIKNITKEIYKRLLENNINIQIKLPHTADLLNRIDQLVEFGINTFHISNTRPTNNGGISGPSLKEKNLYYIKKIRENHKNVRIIAGGGIYSLKDLYDYKNSGANDYSLATIFFKPIKAMTFIKQIQNLLN